MNNKCYLIDVYSVLQEAHISLRDIEICTSNLHAGLLVLL